MSTTQDFIQRLSSDEAFAAQVRDKVKEQRDAKDYIEAFMAIGAELGYDLSEEEVRAYRESQGAELSDEELDQVAGGDLWDDIAFSFEQNFSIGCFCS